MCHEQYLYMDEAANSFSDDDDEENHLGHTLREVKEERRRVGAEKGVFSLKKGLVWYLCKDKE